MMSYYTLITNNFKGILLSRVSKKYHHQILRNMGKRNAKNKSAPASIIKESTEKIAATSECPVSLNKNGCVVITVWAKPGAKQSGITEVGEASVGVAVGAVAQEGAANAELLRFMASVLGVRKTDVSLDRGSRSRQKLLLVENIDCNTALTLLHAAAA